MRLPTEIDELKLEINYIRKGLAAYRSTELPFKGVVWFYLVHSYTDTCNEYNALKYPRS